MGVDNVKDIENGMLCDWYWRDFEGAERYEKRREEEWEEYEDTNFDSQTTLPSRTARDCAGVVANQEVEA